MVAAAQEGTGKRKKAAKMPHVSLFLVKAFAMVDQADTDHVIRWNDKGDGFIVTKEHILAQQILPKFFRHSNFSSFVRQLNFYGFKKGFAEAASCEFKHSKFRRGRKDLLREIKRKTSTAQPSQKKVIQELQRNFDDLKQRNDTLWQFQRKMMYMLASFIRTSRADVEQMTDGSSTNAMVTGSSSSNAMSDDTSGGSPQTAWSLCHKIEELAEGMPTSSSGPSVASKRKRDESSEESQQSTALVKRPRTSNRSVPSFPTEQQLPQPIQRQSTPQTPQTPNDFGLMLDGEFDFSADILMSPAPSRSRLSLGALMAQDNSTDPSSFLLGSDVELPTVPTVPSLPGPEMFRSTQ